MAHTWRKKLIALGNKSPSHYPTAATENQDLEEILVLLPFLTFLMLEPNTEMRYNISCHGIQFTLRPKQREVWIYRSPGGREGTRSHTPGMLQESATQSVFPRHGILSPPVLTQVVPTKKRGVVPQAVSQASSSKSSEVQTPKTTKQALHAASLCVTGK